MDFDQAGPSSSSQPMPVRANSLLTEDQVIRGFHDFLTNALAQAKAERLIDEDTLSGAEADLMICGPALCLFFAALRSTTNPPSVPIPRPNKSMPPLVLSKDTCPPTFIGLLNLWAASVPQIQALPSELQHDLARIICDQEPLISPLRPELSRIATELRGIAIEISQRRTFQERYNADLQAAIDAGVPSKLGSPRKAAFVPPPVYDVSPPSSAPSSATGHEFPPVRHPTMRMPEPVPHAGPSAPQMLSPTSPTFPQRPTTPSSQRPTTPSSQRPTTPSSQRPTTSVSQRPTTPSQRPTTPSPQRHQFQQGSSRRAASPSILTDDTPAIDTIRETLYSALAEVLATTPHLRSLIKRDPSRAYFSSVALAIYTVATTAITPDGSVRAVLGHELRYEDCPPMYRPLMEELAGIGRQAQKMGEEDDERAIAFIARGKNLPTPRLERLRRYLEKGVGYVDEEGNERGKPRENSPIGTTRAFSNRINALALKMTSLPAFRERQNEVFKVLSSVY